MYFNVLADNHMPAPPGIMESYTCNLNPGKDMDDVMAARDYYVKQAEKGGLKMSNEYLLNLNKGTLPFNVVWMAPHENAAAFAASHDAAAASPEMASVNACFASVMTCSSGIGAVRPIYAMEPAPQGDGSAVISSLACNYRHGSGPDNLEDLADHIGGVMKSMGDNAPNFAFSISPITGGPTVPDVLLFAVHDSMTNYFKMTTAMGASEGGPSLGRHFNAVLDCDLALWDSRQVVGGE